MLTGEKGASEGGEEGGVGGGKSRVVVVGRRRVAMRACERAIDQRLRIRPFVVRACACACASVFDVSYAWKAYGVFRSRRAAAEKQEEEDGEGGD